MTQRRRRYRVDRFFVLFVGRHNIADTEMFIIKARSPRQAYAEGKTQYQQKRRLRSNVHIDVALAERFTTLEQAEEFYKAVKEELERNETGSVEPG